MPDQPQAAPIDQMSFEDAMAELERVVDRLEHGDVALEESIRLYERGAKLKAHCEARLKAAEERVEALTLDAAGQPKGTTPVEGL
ncbi:exodeoxyribonuclease VII small subunit [Roseitranquillus sediminis]|uniref:exodeoxyribonuclease VII small subunit n=1 Tax=Roseitranquillus sediminis TaxID=2809051 RepID=UPI001D0C7D40|nr:exodeoxyribonuclease VII small subunit [Roseitranquillus sediminis]MBM9594540.1 exodeoxyribonuclease VII small subunit [Roseitranquillus sediminis]